MGIATNHAATVKNSTHGYQAGNRAASKGSARSRQTADDFDAMAASEYFADYQIANAIEEEL